MRIVITGCGRSGTQYVAALLAKIGLKVGHEKVYRQDLDLENPDQGLIEERWDDREVESSWYATPFVYHLLPPFTVVWHQLRDPLKVVNCWAHHGILADDYGGALPPPEATAAFVKKVVPGCSEGTPLERAIQYVLKWNSPLGSHEGVPGYHRYRLEALSPEHLQLLLEYSGHLVPLYRIRNAVNDVPKNLGSCFHKTNLTWKEVLAVEGGEELKSMALDQGYTVEE